MLQVKGIDWNYQFTLILSDTNPQKETFSKIYLSVKDWRLAS